MKPFRCFLVVSMVGLCVVAPAAEAEKNAARPGTRVLMDVHNCYPYYGWWNDRIDRALKGGIPLAIEQDLYWYTDPKTGRSWSVVAHGAPLSGDEPTLTSYFFDRVRPIVERALRRGNRGNWPIVTLNLDIKTEQPEHLKAIWKMLEDHRDWITSAPRTADIRMVAPLDVRPILVLTGESDAQQKIFYDDRKRGTACWFSVRCIPIPRIQWPRRRCWNRRRQIIIDGGGTTRGMSLRPEDRPTPAHGPCRMNCACSLW